MTFNSFEWISEFISIVLEAFAFWKLPRPQSFRYLMAWLILGNLVAIATHNHLALYGYTLWAGRYLAIWGWLWVAGDVATAPERAPRYMRVPILVAIAAAFRFAPFWSPAVNSIQLDAYRGIFLLIAVGMLLAGAILNVPEQRDSRLAIGLAACLAAEASGALITGVLGWAPRMQLLAWLVALCVLGAVIGSLQCSEDACGTPEHQPEPRRSAARP